MIKSTCDFGLQNFFTAITAVKSFMIQAPGVVFTLCLLGNLNMESNS
jgi:hypothetical protein